MRKDDGFMGRFRRYRHLANRAIVRGGWRPWVTNTGLLALIVFLYVMCTINASLLLPGPADVRTVVAGIGGFLSYYAAHTTLGWLHVLRRRWAMRALWRAR